MKESRDVHAEYRNKIAKDFCTAFVANKMRVTFRTAQNYVSGEVGELWLFLADIAIKSDNETIEEAFGKYFPKTSQESNLEN